MAAENPRMPDSDGRVVPLHRSPGGAATGGPAAAPRGEPRPVSDLREFEHGDERDDYRHRMIANAVALMFVVLLVGAGIWIADIMAAMRKNQDCVLMGRRGCTPVEVPVTDR